MSRRKRPADGSARSREQREHPIRRGSSRRDRSAARRPTGPNAPSSSRRSTPKRASSASSIAPPESTSSTPSPPAARCPESGRPSRSPVGTTWTAGCAPSRTPTSRRAPSACSSSFPSLEQSPFGQAVPDAELEALASTRVLTVYADADSIAAMGTNPLDPASRRPSAIAGRERGRQVAADVAAFWR